MTTDPIDTSTRGLFATPIGAPDYEEVFLTEGDSVKIAAASAWALAHGFDRLKTRVVDGNIPDFTKAIQRRKP